MVLAIPETEVACSTPRTSWPICSRGAGLVTRGEWIEAGEPVKVVEVRGNRVVVARVTRPDETRG